MRHTLLICIISENKFSVHHPPALPVEQQGVNEESRWGDAWAKDTILTGIQARSKAHKFPCVRNKTPIKKNPN